ncbi:glycosyltransferase family 2 protein [Streptomyces sp. SAI-229]|jgi:cellulose synthase/poly-beta-1,6-N-acetylglucosamine synthase-like glycosyltransferase|uniref:glycosyltransferase family 2 protein n=1 Tax=Streptomyces sp. SAI-229 TaxID=3377731 RepID=UPI003C7A2225
MSSFFDAFWSWLVQAVGETSWRDVMPLGIAGVFVWGLWLYRAVLSRFAKPVVNDYRTTTSVVVPAYREDPDILLDCLDTWLAQNPTEVIIVPDVADHEVIRRLSLVTDPRVRVLAFEHRGKRSALGVGIRAASGEVVVLVDSDTRWEEGLLDAVQMPFADPTVGGVGTQQNVYQRRSSVWRRIADWLVNLRYYDYVPAMGRAGAVACLSGRTAAYRRAAITPVLTNLEDEFFLGRRCVAGDDGRLTWLVLASGYKTVHQSSARALSMFPSSFRAFVKQRVRWSRNSYRCYLTALYKGWLWRAPLVTKITVLQILLTPVTMGMALGYLLLSRLELTGRGIALVLIWLLLGRGVRGYSHLRRHPQELLLLPLLAVVVVMISLPIKLYAFLTMNKQGWLTRNSDTIGGEGQNSASLGGTTPVTAPVTTAAAESAMEPAAATTSAKATSGMGAFPS